MSAIIRMRSIADSCFHSARTSERLSTGRGIDEAHNRFPGEGKERRPAVAPGATPLTAIDGPSLNLTHAPRMRR